MEYRTLRLMEVLDGARRAELPTGRDRSLLAILTLHAGRPVASERLIDELWGEKRPTTAATVVHGLVSRLRKVLEPARDSGTRPEVLKEPIRTLLPRWPRMLMQTRTNSGFTRS